MSNLILSIFCILSWNQILLGQADASYSGKFPPILNYVPENELMTLIESEFNFQHTGKNIPTNSRQVHKRYADIKNNFKTILAEADEANIAKIKKFFEESLQLYAYFISSDYLGNAKDKINQLREIIYKIGEWVYLKETDPEKRLYVQILYLAHGIGQPAYLSESISKIIEKEKDAPAPFVIPIKLLLYYNLNSSESTVSSANMILDQISGKLNLRQDVIIRLIALNRDVSGDSQMPRALAQKYRNSLLTISKKAQSIKQLGILWRINSTILDLWLRTTKQVDWRKAPLVEIESKSGVVITPILERIVLEEIASGNLSKGIKTYQILSKAFRNQAVSIELDQRYLSLSIQYTKQTRNYDFLFSIYNELVSRYQNPQDQFEKRARKAYITFFSGFIQYINGLLEQALIPTTDAALKLKIANLASRFTKTHENSRSKILKTKELLARLYEDIKKYKEAVAVYLDLSQEKPLKFYEKASHPQKVLASWPESPPWGKIYPGNKPERLKLIKIFEALMQAQKSKVPWENLAHLGLLYGATGQFNKAEALWEPEIPKAKPSPHVNGASGILLAHYYRQKEWDKFIQLAKIAETKKILPTLDRKVLDMKKFYKIALAQRGQEFVRQSKWSDAISDYEEVVERYPKEPNRPAILAELARLHMKNENTMAAMESVKKLLAEYPNSPLTKKMLLEAGAWGKDSKKTEVITQSAYFYKWFLENFKNDPKVPQARFECANLLITLKQYPQASAYLKAHALDRRVGVQDRVRAALMHINLEDKYGERERAIATLVPIIRLVKPSFGEDLYVSAHVILAKVATEKVDIQKMKIEEKILEPFINRRLDVADALGYLRLSMVNHFEYEIPFPNAAHGIDTFRPAIDKIFKTFQFIKAGYERVCLPRENRYCQQAYGRLKQFSQDAVDAIKAVELTGKIQPKMLTVLEDYKKETLKKVTAEKEDFDKAYEKYRIANERKEFI